MNHRKRRVHSIPPFLQVTKMFAEACVPTATLLERLIAHHPRLGREAESKSYTVQLIARYG
jgi:hypothetical protein